MVFENDYTMSLCARGGGGGGALRLERSDQTHKLFYRDVLILVIPIGNVFLNAPACY